MSFLERLKNLFLPPGEGGAGSKFNARLLLLLILGVALITFNSFLSCSKDRPAPVEYTAPPVTEDMSPEVQERELAVLLNQIRGVSNAAVRLTLENSGGAELAYDREQTRRQTVEQDSGGGTREIIEDTSRLTHVILRDAQGREVPLVVRENQPRYRGVLVVADGVENPAVRAGVVEALRAVLNLPYHRITVLPRGN